MTAQNRRNLLTALFVVPLGLAGCAVAVVPIDGIGHRTTDRPSERQRSYVEAEYAPYDGQGTASITGQLVAKLPDGGTINRAGNEVVLDPVTSYSTEWYEKHVKGGEELETADIRAGVYTRSTMTDDEGRFRFEKLKPGEYYKPANGGWSSNVNAHVNAPSRFTPCFAAISSLRGKLAAV